MHGAGRIPWETELRKYACRRSVSECFLRSTFKEKGGRRDNWAEGKAKQPKAIDNTRRSEAEIVVQSCPKFLQRMNGSSHPASTGHWVLFTLARARNLPVG